MTSTSITYSRLQVVAAHVAILAWLALAISLRSMWSQARPSPSASVPPVAERVER